MRLVWLPFAPGPGTIGELPDGLAAEVWAGEGAWPDGADRVELYVVPYLSGSAGLAPLAQMPALRVVQTLTAGFDDVLPLLPSGVDLCNAGGVHDDSTAELAMALLLAAQRGIPGFVRAQDSGRWEHERLPSLADRRVLLLGVGGVGAAVERRLAGFGVGLVRVGRTARPGVHARTELPDLLPGAEVVVVAVPLNDETRGMVDARFLAALPDGALVVNVARGPVVDTAALLAELTSGRLRAALDVTDPEPPPAGHPLWTAPHLLLSPHVGGDSTAFLPRAHRLVADQLARFAAGQPLAHVVASG